MAENDVVKNKSYQLKTMMNELTKSKQVLDGLGRLEYLYMAPIFAKDGDPCLVVQYSYYGSTADVNFTAEYEGTWDSAYETFTVPGGGV